MMTHELSSSEWTLCSQDGRTSYKLPATMAFLGREECDINIVSSGVDRRHAVITFDHYQNKFKVKDLGSLNGTFLNDRRIPDQTYITMEEGDALKLGYDTQPFRIGSKRVEPGHSHTDMDSPTPIPRPRWEARPVMAECQGCIQEQELTHICGGREELSPPEPCAKHSTSISGEKKHSGPISPLALRSPTEQYREQFISSLSGSKKSLHEIDASMPEDPIPSTHVPKHHEQHHHTHTRSSSAHQIMSRHDSLERRGKSVEPTSSSSEHNVIGILGTRGTPLYGQPTWWGETDADEHNKQLLKEIQAQMEEEKEHKKVITEEIRQSVKSPALGSGSGGDSLSFTVELDTPREGDAHVAAKDKLSTFMPEQLRKSFRERRERRSVEKSIQLEKRIPSPTAQISSDSVTKKPPIVPPKPENPKKSSVNPSSSSSFLINRMFYTGPESHSNKDNDATEYSLYKEARSMNRSSTMPELIRSSTNPQMSKSQTYDSIASQDDGDKVSESGTYTIDEDSKELQKAREDIDKLFGVSETSPARSPQLIETSRAQVGSDDTDAEDFSDQEQPVDPLSLSLEVGKEDSASPKETDLQNRKNGDCYLKEGKESSPFNKDDVVLGKPPLSPVRVSPSALIRTVSPPKLSDSPEADSSSSLRKSTGRRLPSVPHSNSTISPTAENMPVRRKKDIEFSKEKILQELGIGSSPVLQTERTKLMEDMVTSRTHHRDTDPIVANRTSNFFEKIILSPTEPKGISQSLDMQSSRGNNLRRSVDSVNTDILLKDTDDFMKAIHSFNDNDESKSTALKDSDRVTNNNHLNGHSKPPTSKKESVNNKKDTNTSKVKTSTTAEAVTARLSRPARQSRSGGESIEGSTESLNKAGSTPRRNGGKPSTLSSARPNRTFELRKARTDGNESDTSRSTVSTTAKVSRSNSIGDRTEVSLGAKIVQKSRENVGTGNPKTSSLKRTDGGRYSMRGTSSKSLTPRQSGPSTPRQSNVSTPRQSNGTTNRPNSGKKVSRNNSNSMLLREQREKELEKEREKAAWDRRRSYDPRRAVQQAKAKKQSDVRSSTSDGDTRPRSNSYSGGELSGCDSDDQGFDDSSDTRHSADVFQPMESDSLKLKLPKDDSMDSSHELEIAKMSSELAKDLDILTRGDDDLSLSASEIERSLPQEFREKDISTEELVNSMFACPQKKSAFSSYRSATNSVSPETASPALSPMRKKLSASQTLEEGSPNGIEQSYNSLIVASVKQLSQKLRNSTSKTVNRLGEKGVDVSNSPSPTEEVESGMPASHELADILKTLKSVEHNVRVMEKALFDTSGAPTELSTASNNEHEHYLAEIKRIRNEIAGFKPIEDSSGKKPSNSTVTKMTTAIKGKNGAAISHTSKTATTSYKRLYY